MVALAKSQARVLPVHRFSGRVEQSLDEIEAMLTDIPEEQKRFYAIKLLERDDKIKEQMANIPVVEPIVEALESDLDDDSESIITNERYTYISSIIHDCYKEKNRSALTISG